MEVKLITEKGRLEEVAAFVAGHRFGVIEQSPVWGELQKGIPGRDEFFVLGVFDNGAKCDEELVASMLVIRQVMGFGKTWLWGPGGPLLPGEGQSGGGRAVEAWGLLREACEGLAKRGGDVFLRIEPNVPCRDFCDFGGAASEKSYLPRNTLVLDLTLSEEEILKQMAQKGRYNIKIAERGGATVKMVGYGSSREKELDAFYAILVETAKRDGFSVHGRDFYARFLEVLGNSARLYVAYKGGSGGGEGGVSGEAIGGLLATHFGDTATYYFGASAGRHREAMAPYALQWFAIREAKKAGMKKYDFLGVAPEEGGGHPLAGVTQFKTRFGGVRVNYCGARVFVYRRFWWKLYELVKWVRGIFGRICARARIL